MKMNITTRIRVQIMQTKRHMKRFDNRAVIVTGGARGMAPARARLRRRGRERRDRGRTRAGGQTLADELGDQAIFSRLDVTNEKDWAATVAAAEDAFGPSSVLVNNAGIVRFGPIAETEPTAWRQVIDINLTGTYLGIRAVAPSMRKAGGGAIVNTSAAAGISASSGRVVRVQQWGLRGLTKRRRWSLRATTSASTIHPGPVRTPMVGGPDAADAAAAHLRAWRFRAWPSRKRSRGWCCSSLRGSELLDRLRVHRRRRRSARPSAAAGTRRGGRGPKGGNTMSKTGLQALQCGDQ